MTSFRVASAVPASEDRQFYVQEFLGVAAEIADHQAHIAGEPSHVVVKLWVGEKFAHGALPVVEFSGDVTNIRGCIAQIRKERIVGYQFPERPLSIAHTCEQRV